MNVIELIKLIKKRLGKFEEFDKENNGLIFGNEENKINRIFFCWRLTLDILNRLNPNLNTLIICHEPILFNVKYSLTPESNNSINSNKKKIKIIKSSRVNIARFHLSLDSSLYGINKTLIKNLDLIEKKNFNYFSICELKKKERGVDFLIKIKKSIQSPFVGFVGDGDKMLKRVLVVAGGGANKEFVSFALNNSCDALISGDSHMESKYLAYENDLFLIDPGHQNLEILGVKNFAEMIKKDLSSSSVEVKFIFNEDIEKIY